MAYDANPLQRLKLAQWASAAAAGEALVLDAETCAVFFTLYGDALERYARGLVRNRSDAQDIVQSAIERILERYWGKEVKKTLFFTIVHHGAMDLLRARMRGKVPTSYDDLKAEVPSAELGPETIVMEQARESALQAEIARLPAKQRAVVLLDSEQFSDEDIRRVIKVLRLGTVRNLRVKAHKELRNRMKYWR
ncbi:MAG TPA: sigma factor [Chloroflexia bacterium]|nr:sigma factor [Chloroflexia bacterium]